MLQAYIDDSGRGNPPVYLLAGWIMDSAKWAEFSDEWSAALAEPPVIRYFKMKEAASCQQGEFLGWRDESRDAKLVRLASLIKRYQPLGLTFVIRNDSYAAIAKSLISPFPPLWKRLKDPYWFCCYGLMVNFMRHQRSAGLSTAVDFIFDEQLRLSAYVDEAYDLLKGSISDEIHHLVGDRPSHKNDKQLVALQAADMLAWHIRRSVADGIEQKPHRETAAEAILSEMNVMNFSWAAPKIQKTMLEALQAAFSTE